MPGIGVSERVFSIVDTTKLPQHVAALGACMPPPHAGAGLVDELAAAPRPAGAGLR